MRILLGILLIIGAVAFLMFVISPALIESDFVLNVLEPIYCERGDQLSAEQTVSRASRGGTAYSAIMTCMRRNETTYDVTGKSFVISAVGFTVPLLLGVTLIVLGGRSVTRTRNGYIALGGDQTMTDMNQWISTLPGGVQDTLRANGVTITTTNWSGGLSDDMQEMLRAHGINLSGTASGTPYEFSFDDDSPDLATKLKQLQTAYDQHLITRDEFERKRADVLAQFK